MPLTLYLHQIGNTKCIHQQKKKTKKKATLNATLVPYTWGRQQKSFFTISTLCSKK